jgi:hypothetical protein
MMVAIDMKWWRPSPVDDTRENQRYRTILWALRRDPLFHHVVISLQTWGLVKFWTSDGQLYDPYYPYWYPYGVFGPSPDSDSDEIDPSETDPLAPDAVLRTEFVLPDRAAAIEAVKRTETRWRQAAVHYRGDDWPYERWLSEVPLLIEELSKPAQPLPQWIEQDLAEFESVSR